MAGRERHPVGEAEVYWNRVFHAATAMTACVSGPLSGGRSDTTLVALRITIQTTRSTGVTLMLDTLKTTLKLKNPSLLREQAYLDGAWVGAADGGVGTPA